MELKQIPFNLHRLTGFCINCTVVELKLVEQVLASGGTTGINCTVVELKQEDGTLYQYW